MTKLLHLATALLLTSTAGVALAQSGPPASVQMANGQYRPATPAPTYCSADNGVTWVPCPPSGGGAGGSSTPTGTAGSPNANVLSVQGVTGGRAVPVDTVIQAADADRGAIVGTTAVTLIPANTSRRWFSVQNQSGSASCYISGQATATADYHSLLIGPGALYETPPTHVGTGVISIVCTAAGTSVYAREG